MSKGKSRQHNITVANIILPSFYKQRKGNNKRERCWGQSHPLKFIISVSGVEPIFRTKLFWLEVAHRRKNTTISTCYNDFPSFSSKGMYDHILEWLEIRRKREWSDISRTLDRGSKLKLITRDPKHHYSSPVRMRAYGCQVIEFWLRLVYKVHRLSGHLLSFLVYNWN
jgi:hypothetical protein